MLRVWVIFALLLTAIFMGIGLVVSKPWGWSEHASDALYLVYWQAKPQPPYPYFMVNTADGAERWELTDKSETIIRLNCSPDGRVMAILTDLANLYVFNDAGVIYKRALRQSYWRLNVANNGSVILFKEDTGVFSVDAVNPERMLASPYGEKNDDADISSSGLTLWTNSRNNNVKIVSPTGEVATLLLQGYSTQWLASEQLFTFYNNNVYPSRRYLVDIATQNVAMLKDSGLFDLFSPDGTKRAIGYQEGSTEQIWFTNGLSIDQVQQLVDYKNGIYAPICFLTFRPQMLLADSNG
jgi:hypothetical protein